MSSRAMSDRCWWVVLGALLVIPAGAAEGQGLPVRVSIGVRATVLPLPNAQNVQVDTLRTAVSAADTTTALPTGRRRFVVVTYTGS